MNSKEALARIYDYHSEPVFDSDGTTFENMFEKECYAIQKDLDRLEQLEKENQELKEKTEKTIDEFLEHAQKNFRKYAKCKRALDILKDSFEIKGVEEYFDDGYVIDTKLYYLGISKEEYELLKEVLEYE